MDRIATPQTNQMSRTELDERFRFIESVCFFGCRLTSIHLQKVFGIGRIQASRDINRYKRLHPENLIYDTTLRGYRCSDNFECFYSNNTIDEFAYFTQQLRQYHPGENLCDTIFIFGMPMVSYHGRDVEPFITSIRQQQLLKVTTPEKSFLFAPHRLVVVQSFVTLRGLNLSNQQYECHNIEGLFDNFVVEGHADAAPENDVLWNSKIAIDFSNEQSARLTEKRIPLALVPQYCRLLNLKVSLNDLEALPLAEKDLNRVKELLEDYLDTNKDALIRIQTIG